MEEKIKAVVESQIEMLSDESKKLHEKNDMEDARRIEKICALTSVMTNLINTINQGEKW